MLPWQKSNTKWSRSWQSSPSGPAAGSASSLSHDELAILKGILDDMEL